MIDSCYPGYYPDSPSIGLKTVMRLGMRRFVFALFLALVLVLAGCGMKQSTNSSDTAISTKGFKAYPRIVNDEQGVLYDGQLHQKKCLSSTAQRLVLFPSCFPVFPFMWNAHEAYTYLSSRITRIASICAQVL